MAVSVGLEKDGIAELEVADAASTAQTCVSNQKGYLGTMSSILSVARGIQAYRIRL